MVYLSDQIFREESSTFPNFFQSKPIPLVITKMSTLFMLGITAGTILSTKTIPYKLLGLNGVFLLFDAFLNYPYTSIAKYTSLITIGSYYILKDKVFANILRNLLQKQMGIEDFEDLEKMEDLEEVEDIEEEEAKEADEAVEAVEVEEENERPPSISNEEIATDAATEAVTKAVTEAPLPLSPPESDDEMPPLVPISSDDQTPFSEPVPEEYVSLFHLQTDLQNILQTE